MKIAWLFPALVAGTVSAAALASDELDSQRILQLVNRGQILSLEKILQLNPLLSDQRLLDLEVETEGRRIIYELQIMQSNGQVIERKIDAADGHRISKEVDH